MIKRYSLYPFVILWASYLLAVLNVEHDLSPIVFTSLIFLSGFVIVRYIKYIFTPDKHKDRVLLNTTFGLALFFAIFTADLVNQIFDIFLPKYAWIGFLLCCVLGLNAMRISRWFRNGVDEHE